jgi:hypothetical protein
MLEIILIIFLSRKIGVKAEEKGYPKGKYIFMFVAFWILGEFTVAFIAATIIGRVDLILYLFALLGAAIGALSAFAVVNNLAPIRDSDF